MEKLGKDAAKKEELGKDDIEKILSFLPLNDLYNCRGVCRFWRDTIDHGLFPELRLNKSSHKRILCDGTQIFILDLDSLTVSEAENPPFNRGKIEILASWRGILVLATKRDKLLMWNPATRCHRRIPPANIVAHPGLEPREFDFYAFGYGRDSGELKLLRVKQFLEPEGSVVSEVNIYSTDGNNWDTYVTPLRYYLNSMTPYGVFVKNRAHWLCSRGKSAVAELIVGVHFGQEEYGEIVLPEIPQSEQVHLDLAELGGKLCVIYNEIYQGCEECNLIRSARITMWVLQDYERSDSWTQLLEIRPSRNLPKFGFITPASFLTEGELLLNVDGKKFMSFNLQSRRLKRIAMDGVPRRFAVYRFIQSWMAFKEPWVQQNEVVV